MDTIKYCAKWLMNMQCRKTQDLASLPTWTLTTLQTALWLLDMKTRIWEATRTLCRWTRTHQWTQTTIWQLQALDLHSCKLQHQMHQMHPFVHPSSPQLPTSFSSNLKPYQPSSHPGRNHSQWKQIIPSCSWQASNKHLPHTPPSLSKPRW